MDKCLPYKGRGKDDSPPNLTTNIIVKVPSAREQKGHTQLLISIDNKHENICEFRASDSSPHLLWQAMIYTWDWGSFSLHHEAKIELFAIIQNIQ